MKPYVYSLIAVLCLVSAIKTESFLTAVLASFCAAWWGVLALKASR